jgi:hypothetical protein
MYIIRYLPQWLRPKVPKPVPESTAPLRKEKQATLPTAARPKPPLTPLRFDASPPGHPIQWRL